MPHEPRQHAPENYVAACPYPSPRCGRSYHGWPSVEDCHRDSGERSDFTPLLAPTTLQARRFTLSSTVGGGPGFSFDIADAITDTRVTLNEFDFEPGSLLPTDFALTVTGEAFGSPDGSEEISISTIGDLATIDFLAASESNAFNMTSGSFSVSAVPEPSSIVLLGVLAVLRVLGRIRRRSNSCKQKPRPSWIAPLCVGLGTKREEKLSIRDEFHASRAGTQRSGTPTRHFVGN